MRALLFTLSIFCVMTFWACGSKQVAGGSSEETNTIAGVLVHADGTPAARAWVEVRSAGAVPQASTLAKKLVSNVNDVVNSSDVYADTTDAQGRWTVTPSASGNFILVAGDSSGLLATRSVNVWLDTAHTKDTLRPAVSLSAPVACRFGSAQGAVVTLPGTRYVSTVDSFGKVNFAQLPQGSLVMMIQSPDPYTYSDAVWSMNLQSGQTPVLAGPFFNIRGLDTAAHIFSAAELAAAHVDTLKLPLVYEYQVRSWWNFDSWTSQGSVMEFQDSRGRSGDGISYGGSLVDGVVGKALSFQDASQFAVIEDPGTVFQNLGKFSLEAWVDLRSLPDTAGYQMNLVGQIGFTGGQSKDFFSLAVVRDSMGTQPAFAFFLSDGNSGALDTSERVVANQPVTLNAWTYVLATWDSNQVCLSVNGVRSGCRVLGSKTFVASPESIYFGKADFSVALDEVRVIGFDLDEADAHYRWLRRFQ